MRSTLLGLLALGGFAGAAVGQTPRVSVALSLDTAQTKTGARMPIVHLRDLLADDRWSEALDNALPLVVSYRLQGWRSRDGWIDEQVGDYAWQTVVTKEPLQDEYTITQVVGARPQRPARFAVRDSAVRYLGLGQRVEVVPPRPGRFYYVLSARITALTDRDLDQLERFLAGEPDTDAEPGNPLGRGLRRLLLRIAGLPSEVVQARSEQFEVRPNEE